MNQPKFTGERFIPGQGGTQMAYEHLHRYLFALRSAVRKSVLDVASGSGYGTGLLAKVARSVWAVDIDAAAVAQARRTVRDGNISFISADGRHLPLRTGTMDLVVAFEVIEHVRDQKGMVRELARVIKAGGLVLISTPNKAVYSDARKYVNPFHLREFYRDEFLDLLRSEFPFVRLMHQQVRAGSIISGGSPSARSGEILTCPIPGEEQAESTSMYFLACCSTSEEGLPSQDSVYFDPADSLFREWRRREIDAGTEIDRLNREIDRLGRWGQELDGQLTQRDEALRKLQELMTSELDSRDETIRRLQEELERELAQRDQFIRDLQERLEREISQRDGEIRRLQEEFEPRDREIRRLQEEFEQRTKWALELKKDVESRDDLLRRTTEALDARDASLKAVYEHLALIRHAFLYRVLCRLNLLPK